jgi:hypothetical protein
MTLVATSTSTAQGQQSGHEGSQIAAESLGEVQANEHFGLGAVLRAVFPQMKVRRPVRH